MTHYEERLERDLDEIRRRVLETGKTVDVAVGEACRSMIDRNCALASETILGDRPVNRATRALDHLCHKFVARHLPSAGVLRFISAVLRISTALERIGDYAVSIAKESVQTCAHPPPGMVADIEMMAEQARSMLKQAFTAFEEGNAELARGTMAMESQADGVYRKVYRDLLAEGEKSKLAVRDLFALLITFSRLERITDQAKNICEETIFAATGEDKPPKRCRVLFVDERNAGPSLMAAAIAKKAFPEGGRFESAGWEPAEAIDPDLVAYMDRHGHDIHDYRPQQFDPGFETLRGFDVIVALAAGAPEKIPEIPYSTVFLDWSEDVAAVGPKGSYGDEQREALFKLLAPKIRGLIEVLRGDQAD